MKKIKFVITLFSILFLSASHGQSLDSLWSLVVEQSPELKALNSEFHAVESKVDQVSQLPNPTFGVGVPILRPETRLGPQLVMVSASQMFPWFGTFDSKKDVVIHMSETKYELIALQKLDLLFQLKEAYYTIDFLHKKEAYIESSTSIFQMLENIALAKVEAGQALTADVYRIQLRSQELEEQLRKIENAVEMQEWKIHQLTNYTDGNQSIRVTDSLPKIELLNFDTASYMQSIRAHHPVIKQLMAKTAASKSIQSANKKMNAPMIGLGIDYNLVGERTDANPADNGRDILVPKVMLSLPIYRKSYKAKELEEDLLQESYAFKKIQFENMALRNLNIFRLQYENALLDIGLHENQIATTNRTIDVLLVNYSSSGKGFDDLLQLENQLLMHQIALLKAQLDMRIALANIERLTDL